MSENSGSVPVAASRLELGERHEMRGDRSFSRGWWMSPVNEIAHRFGHVDLPGLPVLLEPIEDRLGSRSSTGTSSTGVFTMSPDEVAAVQNERFMNVCDGTSENQWSNTPKPRANPFSTGTCSG